MKALDFTRQRLVAPLRDREALADDVDHVGRAARPEDEALELLTTRHGRDDLAGIVADDDVGAELHDAEPPGGARPGVRRR